jgi:hypothetical protein
MKGKYFFLALGVCCSLESYSQAFVEQGEERGIDVIVSSQEWGAGVSTYDFNQDGYDDITLGNDNEVLFFVNDGTGNFNPVDLNVVTPNGHVKGIVWADINNDENPDLLMTGYFGDVRINKNLGNLDFEDITATTGVSMDLAFNYGISLCDVDKDGYLDIQLCRYTGWTNIPQNPSIEPERWTRLYRNNGDETFTDITVGSGMVIEPRPVFQGVFADFNNNGWPDNYAIVDRVPGNKYFENVEGDFVDITDQLDVSYPINDWMSNSVADYDNDGDLDIFMTNAGQYSAGLMENMNGDGFVRVEDQVGLNIFYFGWGAQWIDFDNDGWQDLFFSTRSLSHNHLYLNDEGYFTDISNEMVVESNVRCYSVAKGDFNDDGFYDLMVQSRFPYRSHLLMNQEVDNHYIKVTPTGVVSNRDAVGTWLKVYSNEQTYVHFTTAGDNYISQNSQHWIFGLSEISDFVDSVEVLYPSGHQDTYYNLPVDSHYIFTEGETYFAEIQASSDTVCAGAEVTLDAGIHDHYLWSTGDTTSTITVSESGVYSVVVTNPFGLIDTTEVNIAVLEPPFIEEVVQNNLCFGEEMGAILLNNLSGTGLSSVSWSNGEVGAELDSLSAGQFSYQYTDSYGCSTSGSVTLTDPQEIQVLYNVNPETDEGQNGSIDLLVFGGTDPYTIVLNEDTVPSQTINGLVAGDYSLTIIDANGCIDQVEVSVELILGTNKVDSPNYSIFPNPTKGIFYIDFDGTITDVSVLDAGGNKVKSMKIENFTLDISDLATGLYFIKITSENNTSHFARVLKE